MKQLKIKQKKRGEFFGTLLDTSGTFLLGNANINLNLIQT